MTALPFAARALLMAVWTEAIDPDVSLMVTIVSLPEGLRMKPFGGAV